MVAGNKAKLPADFMVNLSEEEAKPLRSQFAVSKPVRAELSESR
jgi:hypothetical protein